MRKKLYSIVCAVCLLLSLSSALASCNFAEKYENYGSEINFGVKETDSQTNVATQGTTVSEDDIGNSTSNSTSTTIITNNGNSIPFACAKGLRSAVSIICKFQATVQSSWPSFGSGGTTTQEYTSRGSGVIYQLDKANGDAFIITNYHVVYASSSNTANGISADISIYLYGSEVSSKAMKATYVGGSLYYDIAVLRIEDNEILKASDACAVEPANSDQVVVGDSAIAIGNAKGYGISASLGIVSVESEYIKMLAADDKTEVSFRVIRVDTAVNSGNSGGGLYDDEGNLIGIVNAKVIDDGVENIGYAIPSNIAVSIANNIIDYCYGTNVERVQRALIGITVQSADSRAVYNEETGLFTIAETVYVKEITQNSLADGVLMVGDVLVRVMLNGHTTEITRQYHAIDMMLDMRVGDTVSLTILRNGVESTVSFTITQDCLTAY